MLVNTGGDLIDACYQYYKNDYQFNNFEELENVYTVTQEYYLRSCYERCRFFPDFNCIIHIVSFKLFQLFLFYFYVLIISKCTIAFTKV